jgi:hypothetical protein
LQTRTTFIGILEQLVQHDLDPFAERICEDETTDYPAGLLKAGWNDGG